MVDHHCHLSPGGEGVLAAKRFRAAGGTHLFLTTQNYTGAPILDLGGYESQFDTTEALAAQVQREAGVTAFPVLAPYPIDLLAQAKALGLGPAVELQQDALELAGRRVRDHRAVALGEVGRPHFPLEDPALKRASEELLDRAFAVAHDSHCPAVIHSEDLSPEGYADLQARGRRAGLRPEQVVKHYARARFVPGPGEIGPARSYLARRDLMLEVLDDPGPWFLETDFLDDPARPGAVLDLATVPRRSQWIAEHHPGRVGRLRVPFEESPRKVYGLTLRSPERTERPS